MRSFWIRLTQWEYWPFEIVYLPIFVYWLWFSLKARSLLYFTASNTLMKNGGMLGESKMEIFEKIPERHLPATYLIPEEMTWESVCSLTAGELKYPCIAKPDVGVRGIAVRKINSIDELKSYLRKKWQV